MSKYDDLFDETRTTTSVFADKRALDPLSTPEIIVARDTEERALARILNGIHDGYLPATVAVYGPPGTGKTLTTRRVCAEFAARVEKVAVVYVNLKECRTLFGAANEILYEVAGQKLGAYEGLDGVFDAVWTALESYPEWTILLLDEIDQIRYDTNYDPSEFFYRLLRGEGRLKRGLELSVIVLSNELLEVDLRVDSRVDSVVSGEEVFFGPYGAEALRDIVSTRVERAFRPGAVSEDVLTYGVRLAADRWGDARKTLTLFRRAGETANVRGLEVLTRGCLDANLDETDKERVLAKLASLPLNHLLVLTAVVARRSGGEIKQPVTTAEVEATLSGLELSTRAIRDVVRDLEMMGLVETWVDSRGRGGRVKQTQTTFDPRWAREAQAVRSVALLED
jgi:orc1/cdc6 family replication initiation protein